MIQTVRPHALRLFSILLAMCGLGIFPSAVVWGQDFPITAHPSARSVSSKQVGVKAPTHLADRFDVSYYHLTLNLNGLRNPILLGRNRIVGTALADTDSLQFDLSTNLALDFVSLTSGQVLAASHQNDKITVVLKTRLLRGTTLELDIVYHGNPISTGFGAFTSIQNVPGKPNTIWTLSEPYGSKEWWPADDQLTDKADSVRITVRVPSPMTVASNGVLLSKTLHMDGSATFDWIHRYPISTYLVSLAIGEYDEYKQTYTRSSALETLYGPGAFPIQHFVYKGADAFRGISPSSGWRLALEMMSVFEDWLGPYPFAKEKYGHAHVTFKGGMEHQTLSSMGNIGAELIAHELAHQWFGNKLTPKSWSDLWLNEGFATMSEFLVYDTDAKYANLQRVLGNIYYQRALLERGTLVQQDTTEVAELFDFNGVYAKGYMVLRMIRGIVGDDVFKQILRTYTATPAFAYGSVTTSDFQHVIEEVSGRSFQTFFDQWVYDGTGYPTYDVNWTNVGTATNPQVRITLSQIQAADESTVPVFEMPVWLEITTANKTYRIQVENGENIQIYTIDVPEEALSVRVDPDRWILRGESPVKVSVDDGSNLGAPFNVSVYPNPSAGAINVHIESTQSETPIQLTVFDLLGRVVRSQSIQRIGDGETDVAVDGSGLPAGIYHIRVAQGSTVRLQSFVITR